MTREGCTVGFDEGGQSGQALLLEPSKEEALAAVLSRALCDEPQFTYMIPDKRTRLLSLPGFFRNAIGACRLNGEVYTTRDLDGGALWVGPGSGLTPATMMTTGALLLRWERTDLSRCWRVIVHLDEVRHEMVSGFHWHLWALGVEPSNQDRNVERNLIEPLLARADSENLPCYLETFNGKSLPFYERQGFRIAAGGRIPRGGPDFWAMIRKPQRIG